MTMTMTDFFALECGFPLRTGVVLVEDADELSGEDSGHVKTGLAEGSGEFARVNASSPVLVSLVEEFHNFGVYLHGHCKG